MKKLFIKQIQERDVLEETFLVREKITAMARNGKPYLTLKLTDRTGEVEGRIWERVDEFSSRFDKDDFVQVQAKASVYLGKMQLVIQDLRRREEQEVDLADYLPVCGRSRDEMVRQLTELVQGIGDPHLRSLMQAFLDDREFMADFSSAPAAKTMHHVYLGGLLEHSLAVAELALTVGERYPGLNRDLLVVGALLHDVGKVAELCYRRSFDYTDEGKLLGHIVMGTEMVEEKLRGLPDFPRPLATLLKHLLLSHHGQYEFGSPKRPKTLEAVILNYLDDLDSKINGVRTHIERETNNPSPWTAYHRFYDRYFFKETFPGRPASEEPALPAEPEPVRPAATPPEAPRGREPQERRDRNRNFGFTLADQLKGKSLDLFGGDDEGK